MSSTNNDSDQCVNVERIIVNFFKIIVLEDAQISFRINFFRTGVGTQGRQHEIAMDPAQQRIKGARSHDLERSPVLFESGVSDACNCVTSPLRL